MANMLMMSSMSPLSMNESQAMAQTPKVYNMKDGLVPTTVHEQDYEDVGYHSDDKGFYQTDIKSDSAADASGTSTPLTIDDNMENTFTVFDDSWQSQQMNGVKSMPQDTDLLMNYLEQALKTESVTPTVTTQPGYQYAADDSDNGEDEDRDDNSHLPEILRRSVKGMTTDDKKLRRRELNRLAAQRSRQKKKQTASSLEQDVERLTERNAHLRVELERYEKMKTELYDMIKNHFKNCSNKNNNHNNHGTLHGAAPALAVKAPAPPVNVPVCTSGIGSFSEVYQGFTGFTG